MDKTEMIKDSIQEKIKRLEIIEDERKQFFRECERKSNEIFERKNKLLRIIEEKILIAKHYIQQSSVDTSEGVNNLNYLASIYYDEINLSFQKHLKELEEPFEKNQIGSSAMAYKRNPMRSERISSLAKYIISNATNGALVYGTQWFERTLDDSANKRLSIPQSFLALDAILIIWLNIMDGVVVYPKVIEANIQKELPFMATENIIMESVKKGMDRQEVHEIIRELSMEETKEIKINGKPNNLIDRIIKDGRLGLKAEDMKGILVSANYTGFASEQVLDFISQEIEPILEKYKNEIIEEREELKV